ncbi:hypothetical protein ILUMI_22828 [Ignelater luminosus]|uniref:HMG box domain-containing protein n=1 Tax=Ignelater luminosus TaxID=2038154 RepID=A0A8K0CD29_IGNLU|nr:hypothetical protein ILUMI_22828 [Ignelater luminosus]
MGQGKLISFLNVLGSYRNLLTNRITVSLNQQNANLKTKTREKLKNLKIPEQPKRPLTPYFRFLTEKRGLVQKQHPGWKLGEIAKQCAEDWKNLSKDVKEKYQQDYNDEAKIYEHKQEQFKLSLTKEQQEALSSAQKEKRQTKKKRIMRKRYRESGKPKRPTGTFLFFIKDKWTLPENKNKKLTELLSLYKNEWNNISDSEKQKYIQMHEKDKQRYEKEMTAWEARMIKEGNMDLIRKESQIITIAKPLQLDNVKEKKNK